MRALRGARKTELIRRIQYQMQEAHSKGWYIIFNTLTVNNHNYATVFQNGKAFKGYLRKVKNAVTTPTERSMGIINHHHFAVVEEGDQNGRLHIHVIHMVATTTLRMLRPKHLQTRPNRNRNILFQTLLEMGQFLPNSSKIRTIRCVFTSKLEMAHQRRGTCTR